MDEEDLLGAIVRLLLVAHVSPGASRKSFLSCRKLDAAVGRPPTARPPLQPLAITPHNCTLAPWQVSTWDEQPEKGLSALCITKPLLFESADSLDQQLAALRQRCGDGGNRLPTAAQLQATWAVLVIELTLEGESLGLQQAEFRAFAEEAACDLLALQPDNPRSSYELGHAEAKFAVTWWLPLLHYQRGAELARAQGSDFWLARWAGVWARTNQAWAY